MPSSLERQSELEVILENDGWRAIAKIAKELGVTKHEDGWLETIPSIVAAEMAKKPLEEIVVDESPVIVDEVKEPVICEMKPKLVYATEQFKRNGFRYCSECGCQLQTDMNDKPICPESRKSCPQLNN